MIKIQKLILSLGALILSGCAVTACASNTEYPQAPGYRNPTGLEFPIMASYAFYDPALISRDKFIELHDAGFNLARQSLRHELIEKTLEEISGTGVKMMLYSWDVLNPAKTVSAVKRYANSPEIAVWFVKDEPRMPQFGDVKKINDMVVQTDSTRMTFMNLLPASVGSHLKAPDYETYVEEFVKEVNPYFLSADCYPIRKKKNGELYVYDRHFETLETLSRVARESDRPFWWYVLSNQHDSYPKPTREFLRFQVFSALAYGAQGLSYFTYCLPDFDTVGRFTNAPLRRDGKRTDVWYMVRDVNREVHNLEKVFLGAEVLDVGHTGVSLPAGTKRLRSVPEPFKWLRSDGRGVVVSHLRNGDDEFLMIFNSDPFSKQKVRFEKSRPLTRIYSDGKEKTENGNSITLAPAGYAIYRLN